MKRIYIFTEEHGDILAQKLPEASPHNFGGLDCLTAGDSSYIAAKLAEVAAQTMGISTDDRRLESEFKNFLEENEYIHLDAFIRICLEDIAND